jgi:glycosyltransferase involved in cell wall biosynthesis
MFLKILQKVRQELMIRGLRSNVREVKFFPSNRRNAKTKTVLIIAPGSMPIPTPDWGAVEIIIHETIPLFQSHNLNVLLLNSYHRKDWRRIKSHQIDIILSHNDLQVKRAKQTWKKIPLISVSHYGLAAFPELWHKSFQKTFKNIMHADVVICLSEEIKTTFSKFLDSSKLVVIPNGSDFRAKVDSPKNEKMIYLGKVEARKRQLEYAKQAIRQGTEIEFIGPITDPRVIDAISTNELPNDMFTGGRTRRELEDLLCSYTALLLLSDGEGDALVLYEAQLAGLPIIVNRNSLGSQDESLPWVYVIDKFEDISKISREVNEWANNPHIISEFASLNYSWEKRIHPLIRTIEKQIRS